MEALAKFFLLLAASVSMYMENSCVMVHQPPYTTSDDFQKGRVNYGKHTIIR